MFIINRQIALDKIRETVNDMVARDDRLNAEKLWVTGAIDLLSTLENKQAYHNLYNRAVQLVKQGLQLNPVGEIASSLEKFPESSDPHSGLEELEDVFDGVVHCLTLLVRDMDNDPAIEASGYFRRIAQWEMDLYDLYRSKGAPGSLKEPAFTREALQVYFRGRFPEQKKLEVTSVKPLYGGFSKQTILVSVVDDSKQQRELVIRAERPAKLVHFDGADIVREFNCVSYLFRQGRIPVAQPLWVEEDADIFGVRFMISQRVMGENLGTSLSSLASMSPEVRQSFLAALGKIHTQEVVRDDTCIKQCHLGQWAQYNSSQETTLALLDNWKTEFDRADTPTTPLIEYTYCWLRDNYPRDDVKPALIHGDYGLANVIFNQGQVSAVLDWELAYMGDPCADLINFMDFYDRSLLDIYEKESGQAISEYRFAYFRIFSILKGVHCLIGMHKLQADKKATLNYYLLPTNLYPLTAPLFGLMEGIKKLKNTG